jgi:hypothetical protein
LIQQDSKTGMGFFIPKEPSFTSICVYEEMMVGGALPNLFLILGIKNSKQYL